MCYFFCPIPVIITRSWRNTGTVQALIVSENSISQGDLLKSIGEEKGYWFLTKIWSLLSKEAICSGNPQTFWYAMVGSYCSRPFFTLGFIQFKSNDCLVCHRAKLPHSQSYLIFTWYILIKWIILISKLRWFCAWIAQYLIRTLGKLSICLLWFNQNFKLMCMIYCILPVGFYWIPEVGLKIHIPLDIFFIFINSCYYRTF